MTFCDKKKNMEGLFSLENPLKTHLKHITSRFSGVLPPDPPRDSSLGLGKSTENPSKIYRFPNPLGC